MPSPDMDLRLPDSAHVISESLKDHLPHLQSQTHTTLTRGSIFRQDQRRGQIFPATWKLAVVTRQGNRSYHNDVTSEYRPWWTQALELYPISIEKETVLRWKEYEIYDDNVKKDRKQMGAALQCFGAFRYNHKGPCHVYYHKTQEEIEAGEQALK
ncbi:hypothetical protein EJ02DRAFT_171330 [Clathrospora elynae]|uniref:Uncharacterized protein n=1 Tax=Clathrospora elynae TaxID=706981 RepID=A0A6A5T353_9PLEO|nr:hypothetical protein EJ02DRAFT_171330 [Clathrospora elynae]